MVVVVGLIVGIVLDDSEGGIVRGAVLVRIMSRVVRV